MYFLFLELSFYLFIFFYFYFLLDFWWGSCIFNFQVFPFLFYSYLIVVYSCFMNALSFIVHLRIIQTFFLKIPHCLHIASFPHILLSFHCSFVYSLFLFLLIHSSFLLVNRFHHRMIKWQVPFHQRSPTNVSFFRNSEIPLFLLLSLEKYSYPKRV